MNSLLWFRLGVVAMACLGALALGTGEYSAPWVLAAIPVSLVSVYLCDAKRYLVLPTSVANVLGVVAMVGTLWNFDQLQQDQQLVALAQLLVALQCILFFRPKSRRLYLMLILLSLLEFQVASIVHSTMWFATLVAVYIATGAVVLCLLELITRQQEAGLLPRTFWSATSLAPAKPSQGPGPVLRPKAAFPLALWGHLLRMGLWTFLVAPFVFVLIPRHNQNPVSWYPPRQLPGVPVTGFSAQVRLGELGQIIQNSQEVMRIEFVDPATGQPYRLDEPPLLQGVTLWTYHQGGWSARGMFRLHLPALSKLRHRAGGDLVLMQLHLEPVINSTAIFTPRPVFLASGNSERIFYDPVRDAVRRRPEDSDREFQCRLLTTAFRSGKLRRFIPAPKLDTQQRSALTQLPQGEEQLAQLQQLALQVTQTNDPDDWVARAAALEVFLKDSGRYHYTLTPPARSSDLDPIEDFLLNRRSGHCEYFASALALMLRACGIPSRLIVGFKPTELNSVGDYYVVRQQDAHTWVQAYIPREKLPADVAARLPRQVQGAWMILDPTPASGTVQSQLHFDWYSLLSYMGTFWTQYVVRMNASRQQQFFQQWFFSPQPDGSWKPNPVGWGVVGVFLLGIVVWLWRRRLGWLFSRLLGKVSRAGVASREPAPFYQRLERVLAARLHRRRQASQTPREFVENVTRLLRQQFPQNGVADIPRQVVDCYYQVRFGRRPLSAAESRRLEELVAQLDHALQNGNGAAAISPQE